MQVVLVIGAAEYPLDEEEALWLSAVTCATSIDAAGQAWDREAEAALEVASVITSNVERHAPEPIGVGRTAALGLLQAFHDEQAADVHAHVARNDGVAALYLALRRFGLESVVRRRRT